MDNPNNSGRLRRHNSLPSKFHRCSSLLPCQPRMKRNPYIGSFRHSPPTTFRSAAAFKELHTTFSSTFSLLRNSPYIGWFRHAPPTNIQPHRINQRHFLNSFLVDKTHHDNGDHELAKIINGRLRGGGKESLHLHSMEEIDNSSIFRSTHRALQESSTETSSGTIKMLARLGSWFLFPLAYDQESAGYKNFHYKDFGSTSENLTNWNNSDDENDLHGDPDSDSEDESDIALSDYNTSISVSNVAEAYYAYEGIEEVQDLSPQRLDYEITQIDIARMARNASRHLDVDSILTLPTITYHSSASFKFKEMNERNETFSFVMVPDPSIDKCESSSIHQNDNFCVICMEHFVEGDRLRVLPCGHSFHVGCIDRWLSGSHSHFECYTSGCPTCKKRPLDVDVEASNQNDGSVPSWAFAQLGDALARS